MHAELRAIHASRQQLGLDALGTGVQLHLQRHAMALAEVNHDVTNLRKHDDEAVNEHTRQLMRMRNKRRAAAQSST